MTSLFPGPQPGLHQQQQQQHSFPPPTYANGTTTMSAAPVGPNSGSSSLVGPNNCGPVVGPPLQQQQQPPYYNKMGGQSPMMGGPPPGTASNNNFPSATMPPPNRTTQPFPGPPQQQPPSAYNSKMGGPNMPDQAPPSFPGPAPQPGFQQPPSSYAVNGSGMSPPQMAGPGAAPHPGAPQHQPPYNSKMASAGQQMGPPGIGPTGQMGSMPYHPGSTGQPGPAPPSMMTGSGPPGPQHFQQQPPPPSAFNKMGPPGANVPNMANQAPQSFPGPAPQPGSQQQQPPFPPSSYAVNGSGMPQPPMGGPGPGPAPHHPGAPQHQPPYKMAAAGQMGPPGMGPPGIGPTGQMGSMPYHPGGAQPGLTGAGPPGMQQHFQQQQQQKRLDPNMMPSAVQVMDDDRKTHSGLFPTGYPRAELPPLVTTDFYCEDQGNCNPKFVRSTLYNGPVNSDLLKQSAIPFALTISPVAVLDDKERPLPIIDMGDLGPVRCHRCKAYMCPYMEFNFGGRRFFCPFCKATTDVPTEYFAHLDQNGQRTDICERPELCFGSYEYVATKEYCKNNIFPKAPAFIFMLDVSYNACRTGIIKLVCENIKRLLQNLPKEANAEKSQIKVGFATYDQSVHFYSLKSALNQPKMLIVDDVQDTFVPIVDGFLVDLQEVEGVLDNLLTQIPQMFSDSKITEVVLGPAIQAGMDALKAADRAGKLFVFHTSLPTFEAPGKLKNRDDKQIIGTDKEKTVLLPQTEFYTKLAQDCVGVGCCVDVFLFPNAYVDVATIGAMCGLTGGQVYKYQYFQPEIDGARFLNDLQHDIERPIVFDAIMRVRSSTGIRPTDFFGNFYMQNTTDVELAAIDCDKTVTVEIKHDDKIEDQSVFFQVALLFTSMSGQRRLKIHNLSMNVGADLAALYRSADLFSIISYLTKQGERLLLQKTPRDVRESLVNRSAQILATYRQHCSPNSSLGQLVLPETMKLLPLMVNCIMKHSAFTGGADLSFDDRAWLMQNIPAMSSLDLVYYLYPRIIPVYEVNDELPDEMPIPVRCAYENLLPTGAYLFENSVVIMLWIGNQISNQWIQDVFGVQSFPQINADKHELPEKDNVTSRYVRKIFEKLQSNRTRCMKLYIIKQQDKLEPWFKKFMVEDRGADSAPSYVEFLCHIHKEIRSLLS